MDHIELLYPPLFTLSAARQTLGGGGTPLPPLPNKLPHSTVFTARPITSPAAAVPCFIFLLFVTFARCYHDIVPRLLHSAAIISSRASVVDWARLGWTGTISTVRPASAAAKKSLGFLVCLVGRLRVWMGNGYSYYTFSTCGDKETKRKKTGTREIK